MLSPRGYFVGRYPFQRGGFPATPLPNRTFPLTASIRFANAHREPALGGT